MSASTPSRSAAPSARDATAATGGGYQPAFKDERDASSNLFDLRYLIGGLFSLYGVILVVASFFVSEAKADGIDMDLYLGIGMLVLGVVFLTWARLRPLRVEGRSALAEAEAAAASGGAVRPAAADTDRHDGEPHDVDLREDAGADVPPASRAQADALLATERDRAGRVGPAEDLRDDADLDVDDLPAADLDLRDDVRGRDDELPRGQHRRRGRRP